MIHCYPTIAVILFFFPNISVNDLPYVLEAFEFTSNSLKILHYYLNFLYFEIIKSNKNILEVHNNKKKDGFIYISYITIYLFV